MLRSQLQEKYGLKKTTMYDTLEAKMMEALGEINGGKKAKKV